MFGKDKIKRKRKILQLKTKLEIIDKLERGQSIRGLSKEYDIGRATVHDIKKNKQKILDHIKSMKSGPGKRKTLRVAHCPQMEKDLFTWYTQERAKQSFINREILKAKAMEFYQKYTYKGDFRASTGWLDRFKNRFGISFSTSENQSSYNSAVKSNQEKVFEVGVGADKSYNDNEEDSLRMTLKETLVSAHEAPLLEIRKECPSEIMESSTFYGKITQGTALDCFDTCIQWAQENCISGEDIMVLRNLRDKVFLQGQRVEIKIDTT